MQELLIWNSRKLKLELELELKLELEIWILKLHLQFSERTYTPIRKGTLYYVKKCIGILNLYV